jgi:UDP-glucose 4-epimerase
VPAQQPASEGRIRRNASGLRQAGLTAGEGTHLVRPTDVNGINKAAGEYYHLVYNNVFGVRACSLRLTNVYGPRQLIKHNRQGFIGWFIRLAIEDQTIQIYGDGSQVRDFVYVDDAVDAFVRAGATIAATAKCSTSAAIVPSAIAT